MILYRKGRHLRVRRVAAPEPPFWFATAVAPYSARRAQPVAIDYLDLRASSAARLEVSVCETVADDLERSKTLDEPVLVDAAESAEQFFRRGDEALAHCTANGLAALFLTSTHGALPSNARPGSSVVIATWPLDLAALEPLFSAAHDEGMAWGAAVPILYPATTELGALRDAADLASRYGASFLASIPLESDATAKHALAQTLAVDDDDEAYAMLFHNDLEPVIVATERHIAALAAERGMADFIVPPHSDRKSNWNAAVLLTLTAARMIAMEREIELAGTMARSARAVAELDKPIERIAAAAPLSIVQSIDEVSVDILGDWLADGRSPFVERINNEWRLRRDAGLENSE